MKALLDYYDYRAYLRDYYDFQKEENSFFSYRYMSNRVDIEHSTLIKILQGSRHLAVKKIDRFVKLCKFDKAEAQYFEALVLFGRAKTEKESTLYFEKLQQIKGVKQEKLHTKQYNFFRHWYYLALWTLLNFTKFSGDFKEIAKKITPHITEKMAKEAIETMVELSLLIIDGDGIYRTNAQNISTGEEWHSKAIHEYMKSTILLASDAMDRFRKNERDISAIIFDIPEEKLPEIKDLIYEFRKTLISRINGYEEKSDRVYQFAMQIFPLSLRGDEDV